MTAHRALLGTAFTVPLLYFGTVFLAALFFPGYSHLSQYASELGSAEASYPWVFNGGILVTGLACVMAGPAFARSVAAVDGNRLLGVLVAITIVLLGFSLCMGALFPIPDPRHGAYGVGMGVHLSPFLLAGALWKAPAMRRLNLFLVLTGLVMLVLFVIMMGVGGLVTRSNVGLFQRAFALAMFPWIGVAAHVLRRRLANHSRSVEDISSQPPTPGH